MFLIVAANSMNLRSCQRGIATGKPPNVMVSLIDQMLIFDILEKMKMLMRF